LREPRREHRYENERAVFLDFWGTARTSLPESGVVPTKLDAFNAQGARAKQGTNSFIGVFPENSKGSDGQPLV
jgi:hypothetical protein